MFLNIKKASPDALRLEENQIKTLSPAQTDSRAKRTGELEGSQNSLTLNQVETR